MLLNLKDLLGSSGSWKVLFGFWASGSGLCTSTTWPLWHRMSSLFSLCVKSVKQISWIDNVPSRIYRDSGSGTKLTWEWGDHSNACTGPGTGTNPMGLYFSPTVKKNTVLSELWEVREVRRIINKRKLWINRVSIQTFQTSIIHMSIDLQCYGMKHDTRSQDMFKYFHVKFCDFWSFN